MHVGVPAAMRLRDQIRAEAGPVHYHTDACPPDCEPTWTRRKRPDLDEAEADRRREAFLASQRINGVDLPTVLWRVATAVPALDRPAAAAWFEVEADAVYHIEAELDEGAGLTSVHRLDLYSGGSGASCTAHYTWWELRYVPPARGRLVTRPS